MSSKPALSGALLATLVGLVWGGQFVVGKSALGTVNAFPITTVRYFVAGDTVQLGGILATVVPLDKKLIHGMTDAIMTPCALETDSMAPESGEPSR